MIAPEYNQSKVPRIIPIKLAAGMVWSASLCEKEKKKGQDGQDTHSFVPGLIVL